jgi:hypothetical protein
LRAKNRNGSASDQPDRYSRISDEFYHHHGGNAHTNANTGEFSPERQLAESWVQSVALNNCGPRPSKPYMNKYICLFMGAALLAACEQKETTVTNPPAEKKESNTTIVNPSPATKTETKTDINIKASPSP